MSEIEEVKFDAPVKKKKAVKKAKPRTAAPAPKRTAPFPGLTRTACATACNATGCAISGKSYCSHPAKGGLQSVDMSNPSALKRLQDARDQIDIRLDPDRFK
jgi:hypothetical protein